MLRTKSVNGSVVLLAEMLTSIMRPGSPDAEEERKIWYHSCSNRNATEYTPQRTEVFLRMIMKGAVKGDIMSHVQKPLRCLGVL
jgi:hypothetical protein